MKTTSYRAPEAVQRLSGEWVLAFSHPRFRDPRVSDRSIQKSAASDLGDEQWSQLLTYSAGGVAISRPAEVDVNEIVVRPTASAQ
ncbi:hypothetical protein [Streptomyces lydicus]|uniref:hypothetical protein n=1 Tax=Streptomyces lydicus TaxID=47763 RepID=UPI0037B195F2